MARGRRQILFAVAGLVLAAQVGAALVLRARRGTPVDTTSIAPTSSSEPSAAVPAENAPPAVATPSPRPLASPSAAPIAHPHESTPPTARALGWQAPPAHVPTRTPEPTPVAARLTAKPATPEPAPAPAPTPTQPEPPSPPTATPHAPEPAATPTPAATAHAPTHPPTPRVGSPAGSPSQGEGVFRAKCTRCHGVAARSYSRGQWTTFFATGRHDRYLPIGDQVSAGEIAAVLAYVRQNAADASRDQGAGVQ